MEVAGFVLTVVGTIQKAIDATQSLIDRIEAFRNLPSGAAALTTAYKVFLKELRSIQHELEQSRQTVPSARQDIFARHMNKVKDGITQDREGLKLIDRQVSTWRCLIRFFKASSMAHELEKLRQRLREHEEVLMRTTAYLEICDVKKVVQEEGSASRNHQTQIAGDVKGVLTEQGNQNRAFTEEQANRVIAEVHGSLSVSGAISKPPLMDEFRRTTLVPTNPPFVMPDMSSTDKHGVALTLEGRVKAAVLKHCQRGKRTIGIVGMPGVGKTTTLRCVGRDEEIQTEFTDGVYYISLGMHATSETLVKEICEVVQNSGGKSIASALENEEKVASVIESARKWFEDKHFLLLVDDVWIRESEGLDSETICQLAQVVAAGEKSVMIFTTRDLNVAVGSHVVKALPRTVTGIESRGILLRCASFSESEVHGAEVARAFTSLLNVCYGLPLALAIVGKSVALMSLKLEEKRERAWILYSSTRGNTTQYLMESKVNGYKSLSEILALALQMLEEKQAAKGTRRWRLSLREMYRSLCVLAKQGWIPYSALQHLWDLNSVEEVREVCGLLTDLSLANLEVRRVVDRLVEGLQIHDLVHEFVCAEEQRAGNIVKCHGRLLRGYESSLDDDARTKDGCCEWWRVLAQDDGYFFGNVGRHMVLGGRGKEWIIVVGRPEWLGKQLAMNGILQVDKDFRLARGFVESRSSPSFEEARNDSGALRLMSVAVRLALSSISDNPREIWFQLYARLLGLGKRWRLIAGCLDYIEREAPRPCLRALGSCVTSPSETMTSVVSVGRLISAMVLLENEKEVACACEGGWIVVVDIERGVVSRQWQAHKIDIGCITTTRDGALLVSGLRDNGINVWDVERGEQVGERFAGHTGWIESVRVLGDGDNVVSGSRDGNVLVWNRRTGRILSTPVQGGGRVKCIAVSGDGGIGAVKRQGEAVRVWDTRTGHERERRLDVGWRVMDMFLTWDGKRLLIGTDDGITMWDVERGVQVRSAMIGRVWAISCTSDGKSIVSGTGDGTVRVLDNETLDPVGEPLKGHTEVVTGVAHTARGDHIVSGSWDGTVRVWTAPREAAVASTNREANERIDRIWMSPDGTRVVSRTEDDDLRQWEATLGEPIGAPLKGHDESVIDVAFTAAGCRVWSVTFDGTLRMWELETRRQLAVFEGLCDEDDEADSISITRGGDIDSIEFHHNTVRLGNPSSGDTLESHEGKTARVCVLRDRYHKFIVLSDRSDTVHVFDRSSASCVRSFRHHGASAMSYNELLKVAGEHDASAAEPSLKCNGRRILLGQDASSALATLDVDVRQMEFSESCDVLCVRLWDEQIAFLKLERQRKD